jgi:hypothetical protein
MHVYRFCIGADKVFILGCNTLLLDIWFLRFQDKVIVLNHHEQNAQGCVTSQKNRHLKVTNMKYEVTTSLNYTSLQLHELNARFLFIYVYIMFLLHVSAYLTPSSGITYMLFTQKHLLLHSCYLWYSGWVRNM